MYVSDSGHGLIQVFDGSMNYLRQWTAPAQVTLALDPSGQHLYAADFTGGIREYSTSDGSFVREWGWMDPPTCGGYTFDVGPTGMIHKSACSTLQLFDPVGHLTDAWLEPCTLAATAVDAAGNTYATNWCTNVMKLAPDGRILSQFGDGRFAGDPLGIATDDRGNVFVTDFNGNRVLKFGTPLPVPTRGTTWGKLKALYR